MAHADYECCAVCDMKGSYDSSREDSKSFVCAGCAVELSELGVRVTSPDELVAWVEANDRATVERILSNVGFQFCDYGGDVDEAVKAKDLKGHGHYIRGEDGKGFTLCRCTQPATTPGFCKARRVQVTVTQRRILILDTELTDDELHERLEGSEPTGSSAHAIAKDGDRFLYRVDAVDDNQVQTIDGIEEVE